MIIIIIFNGSHQQKKCNVGSLDPHQFTPRKQSPKTKTPIKRVSISKMITSATLTLMFYFHSGSIHQHFLFIEKDPKPCFLSVYHLVIKTRVFSFFLCNGYVEEVPVSPSNELLSYFELCFSPRVQVTLRFANN